MNKNTKIHPLQLIPGEVQKRRNITLSDRFAKIAAAIGGGSVSRGIRMALAEYAKSVKK